MAIAATAKQKEYLEILFNDLGYTLRQKRDWLMSRFGEEYVDGLTIGEASKAIDMLREEKEEEEEREWNEDWEEEEY